MKTPEQKAEQARRHRERYAADPEKYKARNREHYAKNREAMIARVGEYYQENREAIRERRNAYALEHRDEINAKAREKHRLDPERKRESTRRWRLRNNPRLRDRRLTTEQYEAMLELQSGACAICWTPFAGLPRIDHDHRSGHVRGLLCHQCNVALGLFREDLDSIHRAIGYLKGRDVAA